MAKVMLIAPYARFYINFRWDFMVTLINAGHEVIAIGPNDGEEYNVKLKSIGVDYMEIPIRNTGTNPLYDISTIYRLVEILKETGPDLVICLAIKPILYGSIAARIAKIKDVYLTVTGLGYSFIGTSIKHRILLSLIKVFYKAALKNCRKVFFENQDDLLLFRTLKLLKDGSKALIINGSGVNINRFSVPSTKVKQLSFIIIARLIKDKGIEEFVEASRVLKRKYPWIICKILGPYDNNPASISSKKVNKWINDGVIEYLGESDDVRPFLSQSSVFVLPSYREGTSKAALEAMAMGLPIITTDTPGCRETVIHKENGFLVPVKDYKAIVKAMETFVLKPKLVQIMGQKSREIAIDKYDVQKVNDFMMENMGLI